MDKKKNHILLTTGIANFPEYIFVKQIKTGSVRINCAI